MNEDGKSPLNFLPFIGPALGAFQSILGLGLDKGKRPTWQIPGAAYEELNTARQMAGSTVRPGNQFALDQINRNAGNQVSNITRTAGNASQALSALGRVEQNTNQAIQQNNVMNSQYQFNAKQNLQQSLGRFAQQQKEAFVHNVWEPYQERVQTKASLIGSGLQNIFGGLNSITQMQNQNNLLKAIYGGNKGTLQSGTSYND